MLQTEHSSSVRSVGDSTETVSPETFRFAYQSTVAFVQRQYAVIGVVAAIIIAMGFVYVFTTPPSYTATATLLIDTQGAHLFQQQGSELPIAIDPGAVESQVEILKSEKIAAAVVKKLNLVQDPEFSGPGGGVISSLMGILSNLFGSSEPTSEYAQARQALGIFRSHLSVRRIGLTYLIAINFESHDPDRAARIANAVADAYIDDQLDAKYQTLKRAAVWLQDRLRQLREQATVAERAVVDFKNKHEMVDAGGRTINEQQMAELNSQLVQARAQTAEMRARLDRIQMILTSNSPEAVVDATVTDVLKNPVISSLRTQYLTLAAREEDWVPKYGINHLAVVNLRNQMREIEDSIRNELRRIAETYKSDYAIAKQRENSTQEELDKSVSQSQVTNEAQVALRELQTNAESYQALYDNFLQRYMQSVQQQSFPITDARIVSAATRPPSKSHPKTTLALGLATVLGLALGTLVGAWREVADRVFRTRGQVEEILQTECIALVPALGGKHGKAGSRASEWSAEIANTKSLKKDQGSITFAPGVHSAIVDSPFSIFTEAIRSIKITVDQSPAQAGCKIIGFTSSIPSEGKSTIALAVARLAAHAGARTLLVDCDLRNPSLSRSFALGGTSGLLDVVLQKSTLEDTIWLDEATDMEFLPVFMKGRLAHSSEILASEHMRTFFESLRSDYDYIFVDLAPLMPIVDVRASTGFVDSYIYVVEWGKTRIDFVEQTLNSARGVYDHLLGVVLNKVNLRLLGRFDGRGYSYYYHGNYQRYGYSE